MIYLASPYTADNETTEIIRYKKVLEMTKRLIETGDVLVFSPIVYTHPIYKASDIIKGDYAYWGEFNRKMIDACDKVVVLMLDGWDKSVGIASEVEYAQKQGKSVEYMEYD